MANDTIGKFVGNTVGEGAAFAAGLAVAPLLSPILKALENETRKAYPDWPLDPATVAQGVAEAKITDALGKSEASLSGVSNSRFESLVALLQKAPGIAGGLELIRRGQLDPSTFIDILQKNGLEAEWVTAYQKISATGLQPWENAVTPADLALGLIRGNLNPQDVNGQPMFPTGLSSEGSNVPVDQPLNLDVLKEAAASGVTPERMALLARNVGLPPGVIEGLNMLNRGIINEAAFGLLIEQSDARLSWGPFLLQLRRMLLTAHEYAELYIRGYITLADAHAGGALHGVETADMDLLIDMIGRPLAVHQVTTGLARGGTFGGEYEGVPEPYLTALRQSNIRPEWGNIAYANRYSLPSPFVLKALATAGDIDQATTLQLLLDSGWPPDLAEKVAKAWVPAAPAGTKPKKLTNATIRQAFRKGEITQDDALSRLEANGLSAGDAAIYLGA